MKRSLLLTFAAAPFLFAQNTEHPTGPRITPPTVSTVAPLGISRGTTAEMTIEGFNLANASAIYFSEPGIKGRIVRVKELPDLPDIRLGSNGTPSTVDLGPLPPRNQVTIEVDVSADAEVGPVGARLLTPLGTSPEARFLVEPYFGESPDREPNNTTETAFETYLPSILSGTISRPGDVDYYQVKVRAGEELVFDNSAAMVGSTLQPLIAIVAPDQTVLREFGTEGGEETVRFAYKFEKAGTYYVRVGDFLQSGRPSHFYRIKVGQLPLALSAYPLGVANGSSKQVSLRGFNLGQGAVTVDGKPSRDDDRAVIFRPDTPSGHAFNKVKLALGTLPEVESSGTNRTPAAAQSVTVPVTANGRIAAGKPDFFRFRAQKGKNYIIDVEARRLGSELDSFVEVLDAKGNSIERATVRPVQETFTTLRDHDSVSRGIRIQSSTGLAVGDYMMIGSEILRIDALPPGPDDDMIFESIEGQRVAFFDTSSEAHAIDKAIYKVQIYPPGTQLSPNGLPLVRLYYRNDDGGPGYGKDSLVHFTPPADGEYLVRLTDVRGMGGDAFAYRLNIREPMADFRLSMTPANPNVPVGGWIPVTVTALRQDGFDGPIEVSFEGLPAGIRAKTGTIAAKQLRTTLLLSANQDVKLEGAVPFRVIGRAQAGARLLEHEANPEDRLKLVALGPKPDISMKAETPVVEVPAGGSAEVSVSIARNNGFGGRVPVEVRNLPPTVRVIDVGLNGVLLNEDETKRSFTLEALPNAEGLQQLIYVAGLVETRSNQQNSFAAPQPILLKVIPRVNVSGTISPSALDRSGAPK
jgi:hypothetical protein